MLDFIGRVCILSAMPRRVLLALAGCVLFGALGWGPAPPGTSRSGRPPLRSLIADSRLLALERDNGCLDLPAPAPQAWPDWAAAHIAGGDVPPARVVSDPYPTLHSVAVDAVNDRVFVSDPNRHALWSYDRRAASTGSEAVAPLTGIRGPATGMMFIAAVTVDPEAREIYTVDNDIGDRMMVFSYDAERQRQAAPRAERSAPGVGRVDQPGRARKSPSASRGHARSSSTRRVPAGRMLRSA